MSIERASPPKSGAGGPLFSEAAYFGPYLQAIRIERDIRLEQVAEETRITVSTLEAIEAEDLDRLPPEVFTKGFLRSFAQAVGADPAEAVRRYEFRRRQLQRSSDLDQGSHAIRSELRGRVAIALLVLAVLVAASLFGYYYWGGASNEIALTAQTASSDLPAVQEPAVMRPPAAAEAKSSQVPPTPKYILTVSAKEDAWIKVSIDQGTPSEHTLKSGGQINLEAQAGFNLLIGNAGGIRLTLDGKPVQVPGKRGEVVNLHLP
jgi:cytoskeletal protein RodZ